MEAGITDYIWSARSMLGIAMGSPKEKTLEHLIERSRSLIRQAEELKREHERLLRQLEELQAPTQTDKHQMN